MNFSTAVFLINSDVRAVACIYGDHPDEAKAPRTIFKTFDKSIKPDDLVVIPTDTRCKMTVVKVKEVDIDVDLESSTILEWVISKVDQVPYQNVLAVEEDAIQKIKSAEKRRKQEELRKTLLADVPDDIKTLSFNNAPVIEG